MTRPIRSVVVTNCGNAARNNGQSGRAQSSANRSYIKSIRRTFRGLIPYVSAGQPLLCIVDGRKDYQVAGRADDLSSRVELRIDPNPKRGPKGTPRSSEAIERDRAMFPVDQLHQLLRHSCSDHKRETIAFGRRLESIVGRAHLLAVWKNFIKSRSERRPDRTTPATRLGMTDTRWRWERVLSRRLFPERERLSETARAIYRKGWTRALPELTLKHAALLKPAQLLVRCQLTESSGLPSRTSTRSRPPC